jgi:hypothetical protein
MALSIDVTEVDIARPYDLEVFIGTFPCTDPSLRPYDAAATAAAAAAAVEGAATTTTATAMVGPRGGIVAGPSASNKAAAAAAAVNFPAILPPETKQQPFLLTCMSTPGVGIHLPAEAVISQGGADIALLMVNAASFATPVVASISATGSAAKGGFDVTVTGRHFGSKDFQPMVLVSDTPCAATVWESDSSVVCQVRRMAN